MHRVNDRGFQQEKDTHVITRLMMWAALAGILTFSMALKARSDSLTPSSATSETCFKTGEKTSGLNKICYYNCPSGEASITIKSAQLCPLSIKR